MKRNHHRPLYQVFVCGALVYQTRDGNVAHEYARLSRIGFNDRDVFERTIYRDTRKGE